MSWRLEFFIWLRHQMIVVEDWPYAGTDFTGDPDLLLPAGEDWDEELGKNSLLFFNVFIYLSFFLLIHAYLLQHLYMYADVGAERPADLPHNIRRAQPTADP